jgi:hypothetical protein
MTALRSVIVVIIIVSQAYAEESSHGFVTGNTLYSICTENDERSIRQCIGYLQGITDAMTTSGVIGVWRACIPAGLNIYQIRDIAVQYLYKNASIRQYTASSLMGEALQDSFPCRQ